MQEFDRMNDVKKAAIWDKWQQGRPMTVIARSVCKPRSTVFSYLRYHGGIRPRSETQRSSALRLEEMEEMSRGVATGLSLRAIAKQLSRSHSTISRELSRIGGVIRYRATEAQSNAKKR